MIEVIDDVLENHVAILIEDSVKRGNTLFIKLTKDKIQIKVKDKAKVT